MKAKPTSQGVAPIPALMTAEQVDELLGVARGYTAKLVRRRKLRASRVGKHLRIRGVDVLAFLDAQPSHDAEGNPLGIEGQQLPVPPAGQRFAKPASGGDDAA